MFRAAWLTDLHLNFVRDGEAIALLQSVSQKTTSAVFISGDISEGSELDHHLELIATHLACPVYFVLGNHDFYHSSFGAVHRVVEAACARHLELMWLSKADFVELTPSTALVGHDGWADARLGDYERSLVSMNDHFLIEDFVGLNKQERLPLLHSLGDEAAAHLARVLPHALERYAHVVVLTHVPPFRGACWHQGQISDDHWLPHFTCDAVGQALLRALRAHPEKRITVLCGHTHGAGEYAPLDNLRVITGGAEYGRPTVQQTIEFD